MGGSQPPAAGFKECGRDQPSLKLRHGKLPAVPLCMGKPLGDLKSADFSYGGRLQGGFPAGFVLALPEFHRFGVVEDLAAFLWVAVEGAAGAPGDVAEVANQGALVALLDDPEAMKLWTREYHEGWEPTA